MSCVSGCWKERKEEKSSGFGRRYVYRLLGNIGRYGSLTVRSGVASLRICPGRYFAQASMFIIIASVLHTLTIDRATDEHGRQIVPEVKMTDGVLS